MRNDVKRIDRLITDISQASRLDAELSREPAEPVDIADLLDTIAEIYKLTGLPRGVEARAGCARPTGRPSSPAAAKGWGRSSAT